MKTFVIEEIFPCSVLDYFSIIYEQPTFKQWFHVDRGDQDVEVSEWIEHGPNSNSHQRISFYSMVEKGGSSSSPEVSRCLEIERYEWQKDQNQDPTVLQVYNSITPENGMGNIFKISANWMVSPVTSTECKVWLEAEVECTKKVWGLQNIAEGYLYSMMSTSMKSWFQKGKYRITAESKTKAENAAKEDKPSPTNTNNNNAPPSSKKEDTNANISKEQHIRMRGIGEMNGALIVPIQKPLGSNEIELDDTNLQGGDLLSHFVIETPHLHADGDLDADGNMLDRIRIPSSWLFTILFVFLTILLVYLYANRLVIF